MTTATRKRQVSLTTATVTRKRQVLDFDHPLVRFLRQDFRRDTTVAREVPHHHTPKDREHRRRARYLALIAQDERSMDARLAQYRAYFRLEEAEHALAGGEPSCPCNRGAVLEHLRLSYPEVVMYASGGSPYVAAPPLVDLTEGNQEPRPAGSLRARVAMVAKRTLREEVRQMQVPLRRLELPERSELPEKTLREEVRQKRVPLREPELPEYMRPKISRTEDFAPEDLPFFMRPGRFWATKYPDSDTDEDSYMEKVREGLERLE